MNKLKQRATPPLIANYTKEDARAIQAVAQGHAGEGDQIRAMKWILEKACMVHDETFEQGHPDTSNYYQGRRSVGLSIVKLIKIKIESIND